MRKIWKYKQEKYIPAENRLRTFIEKDKVDNCGCIDFKDGFAITRNKEEYKVMKISFKDSNGMDLSIDAFNLKGLIVALDVLENPFKIVFPRELRGIMDNNIEFYKNRLNDISDKDMQLILMENIRIMMEFNNHKYVSIILYVCESDLERFYKEITMVCDCEVYKKDDVIQLFAMLNNDME
ncbi:hypothetical protein [Amedibacterium intestinale]|uniref:hypothetical protein n=1 Tax=Amedibacterium intestinale TaxID=2583452 RepID=UPI000E1FD77B